MFHSERVLLWNPVWLVRLRSQWFQCVFAKFIFHFDASGWCCFSCILCKHMRRERQKSRCGLVEKSVDMPKSFCQALCALFPIPSFWALARQLSTVKYAGSKQCCLWKKNLCLISFSKSGMIYARSGDKPYRIMPSQLSAQDFFTPFRGHQAEAI